LRSRSCRGACSIERSRQRGREPLTLAELRRLSPEYRTFEALVLAHWVYLIELAAAGDKAPLEVLEQQCQALDHPTH
jgi:hypothetical protein